MPVPVNLNTNYILFPNPIIYEMKRQSYGNINSTGVGIYLYTNIENFVQQEDKKQFKSSTNNKYIRLVENFNKQFENKKSNFADADFLIAQKKFNRIVSTLLELVPETFSSEITSDGSVFLSIKKNEYSFYVQYFFDDENFDNDIVLTGFHNDDKLPSHEGSISSIMNEINSCILKEAQVFA